MANSKAIYQAACNSISLSEPAEEIAAIAMLLVAQLTGLNATQVLAGKEVLLEASDLQPLLERINKHEPIQYVLGESVFMGRMFIVTPAVLIPRPETEELVGHALRSVRNRPHASVLDLGTGSGCIAISIGCESPARVTGVDISGAALEIARRNAVLNGARVDWIQQDMTAPWPEGNWDLVVSNPPYIGRQESAAMSANVLGYEPDLALFAPGNDPLFFYRAIATQGGERLAAGAEVWTELNPLYAESAAVLFTAEGFHQVNLYKDLFERYRFLHAVR